MLHQYTSQFGLANCTNCSSSNRNPNGFNTLIENGMASGCKMYIPSPFISLVLKL